MNQIKIQVKRHLAKTISYRILSSLLGFLIFWMVTNNLKISLSFSLSEFLYKPLVYFIHERVWYKWIKFGTVRTINDTPNEPKSESLKETSIPIEKKTLNYASNR